MSMKILIVEDQFIEANNLQRILERAGYKVCPIARSVPTAIKIFEKERPDMVLIDIHLQGNLTGIDLARELREKNAAFVYLSANSNRQILDAAKATRPYGFLVKPFREKDVVVMLDIAWYLHQQNGQIPEKRDVISGVKPAPEDNDLKRIIGVGPAMIEVQENVQRISRSEVSVLILGESGTGKELVAKAIHSSSQRSGKPLVVVNCATLPANLVESELFGHEKGSFTNAYTKKVGKFELADGGTIFLDEIGEMPVDLQAKLLRVLQEHEFEPIGGTLRRVNVRVIAATNRNLEEEIAAGRFRLDLYYRLNVFPIVLPPLRDRKSDILPLASHFLTIYAARERRAITGFSDNVVGRLLAYSWPGNIRELENLMERSVLLSSGPVIDAVALPAAPKQDTNYFSGPKTMEENERDHIIAVLKQCNWKLHGPGGAAELLKINEFTLRSRMKKLGVTKERPVRKE